MNAEKINHKEQISGSVIEVVETAEADNGHCGSGNSATPKNDNVERWRMARNVLTLCLAFSMLFASYGGISRLQSSINTKGGVGIYSLAVTYVAMVTSSMFLPTFVVQKFGTKTVLFFSMMGYLPYIVLQFYPGFWTLIPTSALVGICGGPLWSARSIYLTRVANEYAELTGDKSEFVINRFFGIFFFLFLSFGVVGNLLPTFILSSVVGAKNGTIKTLSVCGSTFCPADAQGNNVLEPVSDDTRYTLYSVYIGLAIIGAAVVPLFLDSLHRYGEDESRSRTTDKTVTILATFHQMRNPIQVLLLPLTLWAGLQAGFFASDFFQAYVSCAWGVENLGYVSLCYGILDALASISFEPIIRHLGRIPIFILGAILNTSVIIVLFMWTPSPNSILIFLIIAGVWGVADAVWQTQINGIYGVLFPDEKEAAYSIFQLWTSLGFVIAFVNSNIFCVDTKLYILIGFLTFGMTGYFFAEYLVRRKANNSISP